MTDPIKPLPCPFCGTTDKIVNPGSVPENQFSMLDPIVDKSHHYMMCRECGAMGPRDWNNKAPHQVDGPTLGEYSKAGDMAFCEQWRKEYREYNQERALQLWNQRAQCEDRKGGKG